MFYKRPTFWSWFPLGLMSFVIMTVSAFNPMGWSRIGVTIWIGIGGLMGAGALIVFVEHAGTIIVDMIKEARPDTYRLSHNYTLELIRSMRPDQLKAYGRFGNARIGIMVRGGKGSKPLYMVQREDISLEFLNHYLDKSTEYRVCPVSNFMAETHHWDWSKDNIISDYEQAQACRAYLVRNGWAEWNGNGTAPVWSMSSDGTRWTPTDIKRMHGLMDDEEVLDE